ncbi:membrane-associated protein, putative [Bodo saltans]|uniref:Membrane-associated protein, putative n=1 Tax=Bodo saltans TaxID=75058 RepID=A0A0S4IIY5_BODSA|nr:membrane-associated protein, putative [Bodo saltans]|eukprot:CUE73697.1 membrane-associated protein, putative [Bodo saltans]
MGTDCQEDCFKVIIIAAGGGVVLLGLGIIMMVLCRRRQRKAIEQPEPAVGHADNRAEYVVHETFPEERRSTDRIA